MCPLAKVMRRELKKRGVKKLKVVYSEEKPTRPIEDMSISCRSNCICRRVPNTSAQSAGIFPEALHLYHQWQDLSSRARWYRT